MTQPHLDVEYTGRHRRPSRLPMTRERERLSRIRRDQASMITMTVTEPKDTDE